MARGQRDRGRFGQVRQFEPESRRSAASPGGQNTIGLLPAHLLSEMPDRRWPTIRSTSSRSARDRSCSHPGTRRRRRSSRPAPRRCAGDRPGPRRRQARPGAGGDGLSTEPPSAAGRAVAVGASASPGAFRGRRPPKPSQRPRLSCRRWRPPRQPRPPALSRPCRASRSPCLPGRRVTSRRPTGRGAGRRRRTARRTCPRARHAAREPAPELPANHAHGDRPQPPSGKRRAARARGSSGASRGGRSKRHHRDRVRQSGDPSGYADPAIVLGVRPKGQRPGSLRPQGRRRRVQGGGLEETGASWVAPGSKKPYAIELISPDVVSNPVAMAVAEAVAAAWRAFGLTVTVRGMPPAEYVDSHLRKGDFQAAVVDVTIGLDPDLYPLFASTQVTTGGSNITGIQDVGLDRDLTGARSHRERWTQQGAPPALPGPPRRPELRPADRLPGRARGRVRPGPGTGHPRARGPQ